MSVGKKTKIRVEYSINGPARFISHLDLMRTIFRGIIRAEIPIKMSEGFSPHQLISFGPPLSVGMEGNNEFLDFEIKEFCDLKKYKNELEYTFRNILEINEIRYLQADDILTKDINIYDYRVYLDQCNILDTSDIQAILSGREILAEKVRREKTKKIDIKPFIEDIRLIGDNKGFFLDFRMVFHENSYISPYEVIKVFLKVNDNDARAFKVCRKNMSSTRKGKSYD